MILLDTIRKKLISVCESPNTFRFDFDVRFLTKWINKYPQCFPKYVINGNYEAKFVWLSQTNCRWEIHKTK